MTSYVRISTASDGTQADGRSWDGKITPDGRYVVFTTDATNISPSDTNATADVYRKDLLTGEIIRVSMGAGGTQGNGASTNAEVTADGRFVVFQSSANNLVLGDTNNIPDVFLKDVTTGHLTRISLTSAGQQAEQAQQNDPNHPPISPNAARGLGSFDPDITPDGRYAVFASNANNMVLNDRDTTVDIYRIDLLTGTLQFISSPTNGQNVSAGMGLIGARDPSISNDGRFVAFTSSDVLTSGPFPDVYSVYIKDILTGNITSYFNNSSVHEKSPHLRPDGVNAAFYDRSGLADLALGILSSISNEVSETGQMADGKRLSGASPTYSPDGSFLAFGSFLFDMRSRDAAALLGLVTDTSSGAKEVLVESLRGDLIPNDSNSVGDIFVATQVRFGLGTSDDDFITGGAGLSTIFGYEGADSLQGAAGDDFINGGAGDDYISGEDGSNILLGESGDDTIYGAAGQDFIDGGSGDDFINGDAGDDVLVGESGDDIVYGSAGNDRTFGGEGDDSMFGGAGNDFLEGWTGKDVLWGDEGQDELRGGGGDDHLDGSIGDDILSGYDDNDYLEGWTGNDRLFGESGNDQLRGGWGDDLLDGGPGDDAISGFDGNDYLEGWTGNDRLLGDDGDDELRGGDGDDRLEGGTGNDVLRGWSGRDTLVGGDGNDILNGDWGDDYFEFFHESGQDQVVGFQAGATSDDVIVLAAKDHTFAGVFAFAAQVGDDTVLHLGGHNTITLEDVAKSSLHERDFLFL